MIGTGVILKIKIWNGKDIKNYSANPSEQEILLSPNMKFVVTKGFHEEKGWFYVHLIQCLAETFVF